MNKKMLELPKFKTESDEADWWASPAGRSYVKQKAAEAQRNKAKPIGSSLVARLNKKPRVQGALAQQQQTPPG